MNGVHDMGGMHGFGPVEREVDEPVFHAPWEGRVRAMAYLSMQRRYFNVDAFRHGIELMPPAEYLRAPYFERWLTTVEHNLVERGFVRAEEIESRLAELRAGEDPTPVGPLPAEAAPLSPPLPELRPRFALGDAVVTRNVHPEGHTRLPRYARGKRGWINRIHGPQIFPDAHAHGLGEQPQVLYSVAFDATELWGESAEPRQQVCIDLWESYLEAP